MVTLKVEGFKELEAEIAKIEKNATRKAMARRVLRQAGEPLARSMRSLAPRDEYDLVESIDVSTVLSGRQRGLHRKRSPVEMFVGAGPLPQAHTQEFGTVNMPAQPFARPAWDADQRDILKRIRIALWDEITKTLTRQARR